MKTEHWKQTGTIYLWRYLQNTRNYRGWNMTADAAGVRSLLALFDYFANARDAIDNRSIMITPPTPKVLSVPNNKNSGWVAPNGGAFPIFAASNRRMSGRSPSSLERTTLTIGVQHVQELLTGIEGISRGEGDYSIGDNNQEEHLWFWWSLEV